MSHMERFREALDDYQLNDLGYIGPWFTWERGNFKSNNVRERLNQGVVNST